MKNIKQLEKEIEDLKRINKKAEEDFNATINSPKNNIYDTNVMENTFLEMAHRVKVGQYSPEFFSNQMNIYWRQIVKHFRDLYDKNKK